jgi:hypothetical protein
MKKINIILILFVFTFSALAQEKKEKQTTQAEQFSAQAGTLIEKQFVDIGKVKGINVQVMKIKDVNSGASKNALRFEYEFKSQYSTDSKIGTLDLDEIDGLIKSMTNLKNNVFPTARDIYTEVTFRSRTGFEAGSYYSPEKSKWSTWVQIEKYDRNSMVFLTTEDFTALLTLIEQAKTKM